MRGLRKLKRLDRAWHAIDTFARPNRNDSTMLFGVEALPTHGRAAGQVDGAAVLVADEAAEGVFADVKG